MSDYPEHDKMQAVKDDSSTIGDFLEWLESQDVKVLTKHAGNERLAVRADPETLLYEYFQIDRSRIEAEKNQMLEKLRASNEQVRSGVIESRDAQPTPTAETR